MIREIIPHAFGGHFSAPPSKSASQRALLATALSGRGIVRGILDSDDVLATCRALPALGVHTVRSGATLTVTPGELPETATVNCGESGATLRMLLPILAARGVTASVTGKGRLPERPLGVYDALFPAHGVTLSHPDGAFLPLSMEGTLTGGDFSLRGDLSSQFISGLMMALPLCEKSSRLRLTTPCESLPYVEMTMQTLFRHGITVEPIDGGWFIPGGQTYAVAEETVEGDWTQAAVLLAAGAIGGHAIVTGLDKRSYQGDRAIVDLLRQFGADIRFTGDVLSCYAAPLHAATVDVSQIPDLMPILAVLGAYAEGTTQIVGAKRLRYKECDRLSAMAEGLQAMGVKAAEASDALYIMGSVPHGATVDARNDHRIAMAFAVAALNATGPIKIRGAEAVAKSWPHFYNDFARGGGISHVILNR